MTAPQLSPELRKFLTDWLEWAENGAPDLRPFLRLLGLCSNAPENILEELQALFEREFGDNANYPFGGRAHYWSNLGARTQHLDPARLAWVRAKLGPDA